MKAITQYFLITIFLTSLMSFINAPEVKFAGTYNVYDSNTAIIELVLNEDMTFTYVDHSNSNKKIDVSGTWEVKNNHILLKNYESEYSFHDKWKIEKNGMVAKSRHGITFYTLVKSNK